MWGKRLSIEVTNRCNFNCLHCFNRPSSPTEYASIDFDSICRLVDEAYELGCRDILLTGGEPLLWGHFVSFYEMINQYANVSVRANTNASLINEEIVDLFCRFPPSNIHIGIYGWDNVSYCSITGNPSSHSSVVKGISLLATKGLPYHLVISGINVLAENESEVSAFAQNLGAQEIARDWILGGHVYRNEEKNDRIRRSRLEPRDAAKMMIREQGGIDKIMKDLRNPSFRDYDYVFSCLRYYKQVIIDSRLNLLPCIIVRHPDYIYNLESSTLHDGLLFVESLSRLPHSNPQVKKRCGRCKIRGICRNCPANAYLENGDHESIGEYFCQISHQVAEILGLEI